MNTNIDKINWKQYETELMKTLSNEKIWEMGCMDEYNPHTENIANIRLELSLLSAGRYDEVVLLHGPEYFVDFMQNNTDQRWQDIFTMFCHQCFKFWIREGYSVTEAHARAKAETLALKHDPFSPHGEEVDKRALKEWERNYSAKAIENVKL